MLAYRYDADDKGIKKYTGIQECQIDPVASKTAGKDIFLLPANCTHTPPPAASEGFDIVWDDEKWIYLETQKEEHIELSLPAELTKEEKIMQLDTQYQSNKQMLQSYYFEFMLVDDTEGMKEIKQELADLAAQYDADLAELKGAE